MIIHSDTITSQFFRQIAGRHTRFACTELRIHVSSPGGDVLVTVIIVGYLMFSLPHFVTLKLGLLSSATRRPFP